jgi:acetyl esterase/lipase
MRRSGGKGNRYVLHLHGGAYLLGFPALFRDFTWRIADVTGARVLCIDYRLAPEHPFPAAIDDVTAAYRWLIAECADPCPIPCRAMICRDRSPRQMKAVGA